MLEVLDQEDPHFPGSYASGFCCWRHKWWRRPAGFSGCCSGAGARSDPIAACVRMTGRIPHCGRRRLDARIRRWFLIGH